jgi:DNA/RNA-binding domain of Phe-tRNA-synthetase-like protein
MNILIDKNLKELTKDFFVGVLECEVKIYSEVAIEKIIKELEEKVAKEIDISEVVRMETIIDGRNAYKKYGKDPSRYRLAVESLYRRLSKGNRLYRINNIVDLGNIISLETRRSVAVLDYNKIDGDIVIRLGTEFDEFYGIGRGKLNIKNIPLYADSIGPFGSTTSDTERTMITDKTTKILLFIISFNGITNLVDELEYASNLYCKYAKGSNVVTYIK